MNTLRNKMTTAELAQCLGIARQTVNRWTREQGWKTETIPGIKGGRARVIHIDQNVRDFLANTTALRQQTPYYQAAEPTQLYASSSDNLALGQIVHALQNLTADEQQRLAQLLVREGIHGFLRRLDIEQTE